MFKSCPGECLSFLLSKYVSYIGSVTQNCLNLRQTDCINKSCNVNATVNKINMGLVFCGFITDFDFLV